MALRSSPLSSFSDSASNPRVAIGAALVTEVFGFGSGVAAHARARTVDWKVAQMLATVSIPTAIVGSLVAGYIPAEVLKLLLGFGLLFIALTFVRHDDKHSAEKAIAAGIDVVAPSVQRLIVTRDGERITYELCRRHEGRWFAAVGGAFVGLISTGLGELNSYALVMRCRIPTRVTVATSVVVVAVTALAASVTHLAGFVQEGTSAMNTVLAIVTFTVPGVIFGGQLGPQLSRRVPERALIRFLGWLFVVVGVLTLGEVFLSV